jgi:hypothetical protein
VDLAIDAVCTGSDPRFAFADASKKLGYSRLTVDKMVALENHVNRGPFESTGKIDETRINRLLKLRDYLQEVLNQYGIRKVSQDSAA